MGKAIRIHEYMAFYARNLLSGVISFLFCRINIFHTLRINDAETRLGAPSIFDTPILD